MKIYEIDTGYLNPPKGVTIIKMVTVNDIIEELNTIIDKKIYKKEKVSFEDILKLKIKLQNNKGV